MIDTKQLKRTNTMSNQSDLLYPYGDTKRTPPPISDEKKLRRRIEDYLRKYATTKQLHEVAEVLGVKTD